MERKVVCMILANHQVPEVLVNDTAIDLDEVLSVQQRMDPPGLTR